MSDRTFQILRTLVAIGIALILAFFVTIIVSEEPMEAFSLFLFGPLRNIRYMGNVVESAIPLAFAGLATSILFSANLFNLGSEGIYYISGLVAATFVVNSSISGAMLPLVAIIVAGLVGMALAIIPGFLKAKWDVNVLVTSLMFNSIYFGFGLYFLNYYLRDPNISQIASHKFPENASLSRIISGTRIHSGLIILIAVSIIVYIFLFKTKWGYGIRMYGMNNQFIKYAGAKPFVLIMLAHLAAGLIAGIGGSVEVLGMYTRFRWAALPGLGFDGALVAMLSKNRPFASLGAALFIAYIRIGADLMSRLSDVPSELVAFIQALIILLISAERFLFYWRQRVLLKEAGE
ncbi:MAG: ABC transporter permease [Clostridia bacterium]